AVDGLEAGRAGNGDVLTELRGKLRALGLDLRGRVDACGVDRVEHLLRERLELVVLRDRLGLAADGDHRALRAVVGQAVADEPFGRLAARTLRGTRHALLA